jgi:predicted AAA+ superfamily ATPase
MGNRTTGLIRSLSPTVTDRLRRTPVLVLTGARQTGKSTLARGLGHRRYVTLDSLTTLDVARNAPDTLLAGRGPVTIDEVQRAPDLLLAIKEAVDRDRTPGRFLLTGSANLLLLRGVGETLAGRATHLVLRPMTEREKRGDPAGGPWASLLDATTVDDAVAALAPSRKFDWRKAALEGGLPPAALSADADDRHVWFEGYVDTFLRRDLRDIAQVDDVAAFGRLLRLAALRTGGLLNQSDLARDAAVPRSSAQRWLSILDAMFVVTLLQPFAESRAKRLIKSPKLYSMDTGLALHVAGVDDADGLRSLPTPGAWLENLVLNDVLAWRETEIRKPGVHYYRTTDGAEIDLVIERGRRLLPIEIKSGTSVRVADARTLDAFCAEFGKRCPFGIVAYDGAEVVRLTRTSVAVPVSMLL